MNKERSIPSRVYEALQGTPPTTRCAFHLHGGTTIRPNLLLQTAMYYDALQSSAKDLLVDPDAINQRLDYCLTRIAMSVQRELDVGTLEKTQQGSIQPCNKHDFWSKFARQIKRIAYAILDVFAKICMQPTPAPLDEILSSVFSDQYTDRPYYERQAEKLNRLLSRDYVFTYTIPDSLQAIRKTYDVDISIQINRYHDARNNHADDQDITSAVRKFKDGIRNCKQRATSLFGGRELGDQVVDGLNAFSRKIRRIGEDAVSKVEKYSIKLNHQYKILRITQKAVAKQQALINQAVNNVHVQKPTADPMPVADQSVFSTPQHLFLHSLKKGHK